MNGLTQPTEYRILLYYQYVHLDDPVEFAEGHRASCNDLGLKGRIIVASEGINGTVSGTVAQTNAYMALMQADDRFSQMAFKVDAYHRSAFRKLIVRVRPELVRLGLQEDLDPRQQTGRRLAPTEFREYLDRDDVVVIDGRNDYEYDIGHFRNAIRPDVQAFRQFPAWIREHRAQLEGKTLLTYCTGGIRCEKLSGLLLREGFADVCQLDGGIVTYGKDPAVRGQRFDGKCYVFDERIAVPVNQEDPVVVGHCWHCDAATEAYINCAYPQCHLQHLACQACQTTYAGYCAPACRAAHAERVLHG